MQTEFQHEEGRWAQSLPTTAKELLVTDSCWKEESQFSSRVNDIPAKATYPWLCGQNKLDLKQTIRYKIGWIWEVGIDVGGKRINRMKRPLPNPRFPNHANFTFTSRVSNPGFNQLHTI